PVVLKFLGIADLGIPIQAIGALVAIVGVVVAAVALWLRRSYKLQTELRDAEAKLRNLLGPPGLADLAEAEDLLSREETHVAQIERLNGQLEGLVGKEPTERLPTTRDAAALEIA